MDLETIKKRIDELARQSPNVDNNRDDLSPRLNLPAQEVLSARITLNERLRHFKGVLYGLPLIGPFVKWCAILLRLQVRLQQTRDELDATDQKLTRLRQEFGTVSHHLGIARNEIADLRAGLAKLQDSLATLQKGGAQVAPNQGAPLAQTSTPDSLYLAFEEQHRSKSEDLLKSYEAYAPYLEKLSDSIRELACVDIGCGRGEWLQFLKDRGLNVLGVDSNEAMVKAAQAKGLAISKGDGVEHLIQMKSDSAAIISAFHVVEHLDLGRLVRLIDESFRVLARGGFAIFETPNPENLLVGACNFYSDPTHRNPIPPQTLDFLVLRRGFNHTDVLRKSLPEARYSSKDPAVQYLLSWFQNAQDYAIIAYKV